MTPTPHAIEFRVRYGETDQMGVVYHAEYVVWCDMGRTELIRAAGLSYADLERSGVALAVTDLSVRYHAAARYDDMIRVETTLREVRSRAVTFEYVVKRAGSGERLASARTVLVALDTSKRPTSLPLAFRDQLAALVVAPS